MTGYKKTHREDGRAFKVCKLREKIVIFGGWFMIWQRNLARVVTERVSGISVMPQGTKDKVTDLLEAMFMKAPVKQRRANLD